ncbi:uncharacterized protein LOC131623005 [Vicia villosa]|uniref:uncharacterized protein LOC131623005 n=1 Tax=Vicia villosa TaxID=3911 RepID=UPI00273B62B8|nr:uncharacterized protein LOC131623005 [Vicia villosa]
MESGGCSNNKKPVKIVIITTQYVETDAMSFKSVVQKLTGKHSSDDRVDDEAAEGRKAKKERNDFSDFDVAACESGHDGRSSFFISDSLLNECDILFREMQTNNHFLFDS